MAKIKSDKHGIYFIYNGAVWRPIIPDKEQSIASARNMLPSNSELLIGANAKPTHIEDFFIHVVINDNKFLWYNHGRKHTGVSSEHAFRDFIQEDDEIGKLMTSGLTMNKAYAIFWKNLNTKEIF